MGSGALPRSHRGSSSVRIHLCNRPDWQRHTDFHSGSQQGITANTITTTTVTAAAAAATTIVPVTVQRPPRWPSGKASGSRAEDPGFESRLRRDFSRGRVIPVT